MLDKNKICIQDKTIIQNRYMSQRRNIKIDNVIIKGKAVFNGTRSIEICNSKIVSQDALWHSQDIVIYDSLLKGDRMGWYAKRLTLINCVISGDRPLCFGKEIKLVNCKMLKSRGAFENSEIDAQITSRVDSIKNPRKGRIQVRNVQKVILDKQEQQDVEIKII